MQLAAITSIITLGSAVAHAGNSVPANVRILLKFEAALNDLCRGGRGDDPKAMQAAMTAMLSSRGSMLQVGVMGGVAKLATR